MEEEKRLEHFANFRRLPVWQQAESLEKEGTEIARREHKGWVVKLYDLDNFFVELWERQELKVTTTFRKSARPLDILEPYTEEIQVQNLTSF